MKKFGAGDDATLPVIQGESSNGDQAMPPVDRTYKLYYGGAQKRPDGNYSRTIRAAVDGRPLAQVGESNRKDIRNAVEAAVKAQPGWSKRSAFNRQQILYYLAENLELRAAEFAANLVELTGATPSEAAAEVAASVGRLFYWAAYADKYGGGVQETQLYGTVVKLHEPVGVVGVACPDATPLLSFVSLVAPAVARGNAVVVIPSQKFPLPALSFYQVPYNYIIINTLVHAVLWAEIYLTKIKTFLKTVLSSNSS